VNAPQTSRYLCPITGCAWHHDATDPRLTDPADQGAPVEVAIRDHCDTHTTEDWLREISTLRAAVNAKTACAACIVDRRTAEMLKQDTLPSIFPAYTVFNGTALCAETHHISVSPTSGILRPDQNSPIQLPPGLIN
jgi:hypothetical protein